MRRTRRSPAYIKQKKTFTTAKPEERYPAGAEGGCASCIMVKLVETAEESMGENSLGEQAARKKVRGMTILFAGKQRLDRRTRQGRIQGVEGDLPARADRLWPKKKTVVAEPAETNQNS